MQAAARITSLRCSQEAASEFENDTLAAAHLIGSLSGLLLIDKILEGLFRTWGIKFPSAGCDISLSNLC